MCNNIYDDLEFFQRIKDEKVDINENIENFFYRGINTIHNNFSAIKNELNYFQIVLLRNFTKNMENRNPGNSF